MVILLSTLLICQPEVSARLHFFCASLVAKDSKSYSLSKCLLVFCQIGKMPFLPFLGRGFLMLLIIVLVTFIQWD